MKRGISLLCALALICCLSGCKSDDYKFAQEQLNAGNYDAALEAFAELGDYKDSAALLSQAFCEKAEITYNDGDLLAAIDLLHKAATPESNERANEIQLEIDTAQATYDAMQQIAYVRKVFFGLSTATFDELTTQLLDAVDAFRHIEHITDYPDLEAYADQLAPNLSGIEGIYSIDADMMAQYRNQLTGGDFFMFPSTVQLSLSQSEDIYRDLLDRLIAVEFPVKYTDAISVEE